jgi:aspartyl-tRNA(Asn)/glutamyl-tRNA(Gln) amidotransferase subunit B
MAEYYEVVAEVSTDPKMAANWVMGDLAGLLKAANKEISESPIPARYLGELVGMIVKGELTGKMAKEVLPKIVESGDAPSVIVEREGMKQISDSGALEKIVDEVIAANPKQVEQFKSGKTTVIGFLVGQVMKSSRGQANPATVNEILKSRLE